MIYDDLYNDLNLHLICDNIVYLVFVLTSTQMANYLGARHHHANALCMITGVTGREYIFSLDLSSNMHDKCFNT